jgi:uncharacterized oxidoreductase
MQLSGKTILVTGGTDGIGLQLIRQLKAKGATVITSGRSPERVGAAQAEGFEVIAADLATRSGVDTLIAGVAGREIDVLVNNAGAGSDHDFRDRAAINLADNDACIFLNLNAPVHLITQLMPVLKSRPEAMIVNVTSGLAIAPRAGGPIYCATKAGLRSYTQALRAQLRGTSIHIVEALPPVVATKMTAGRGGGGKMSAADCAAAFVRAMEANANEANVGQVKLLKLVYSMSPAIARKIMLRF